MKFSSIHGSSSPILYYPISKSEGDGETRDSNRYKIDATTEVYRVSRIEEIRLESHIPESSLRVTSGATTRAFNTTLLSERSGRTALLPWLLLLLERLLRLLRKTLRRWGTLLLHTSAIVLLWELALLVGIVLESHFA